MSLDSELWLLSYCNYGSIVLRSPSLKNSISLYIKVCIHIYLKWNVHIQADNTPRRNRRLSSKTPMPGMRRLFGIVGRGCPIVSQNIGYCCCPCLAEVEVKYLLLKAPCTLNTGPRKHEMYLTWNPSPLRPAFMVPIGALQTSRERQQLIAILPMKHSNNHHDTTIPWVQSSW